MLTAMIQKANDAEDVFVLTLQDNAPTRGRPFSNVFCLTAKAAKLLADTIQAGLDFASAGAKKSEQIS